ncbi:hybrid sensor histidine kinase/response regulator [Paracidobacterium acidisoli]|uniref:histidine kinase n=1 Tax=Paracidobacterium acidisoli TaxID=2303751 RepID=A0A372IK12_9BACT|nr:PAS domain S-box protein [Paracidobacterium acidisoli]MBT9332627.1 PAS domain S-box protein [Paracidobacterium acidisoli]
MTVNEKVNILMVDDQPGKLLTYEAILAELGENLIKAASAREALEVLLRTDIAVVLMDVSMPDLDGFELAGLIRQHPRFQKTAIIFISGVHLSTEDTINGYRRGAVDYISVPVIPEVLRARIGVFVELHRKTRMLERLNNDLERRVEERTEELRQSEDQFRTLANSIPQLAWMAQADGTAFWYSQRWCDFSGVSMPVLLATGWAFLCHPDHADRVAGGLGSAVVAAQPWEDTFPLRSRDGEYRWFLCRAVPIVDSQGKVARWFGTATDVTAQIAAEEHIHLLNRQLELRVAELETIMRVLPVGVAISADASSANATMNPAFRAIFGTNGIRHLNGSGPADGVEKSLTEHAHLPFLFMNDVIHAGRPVMDAEMQLQGSDGLEKYVLASASPVIEPSGNVRGAVGVFFDVSHRKRLENTLRERAELLELASEGIMVRDMQGVIRYWNSGAESCYGWRREDVHGQDVHALLQTVFPVSRDELNSILLREGSWRGKLSQRTSSGHEVVVDSHMVLDRETGSILEINRDITRELRAEEALRQAEKLAAMGRMAGIIAHEINNPLEAITNAFYLLRNHPSLDDQAKYYADMAEQELQRASHITRQTLSFYRESKQPVPVSLPEVIESVLELQQRGLQSSGIDLQKQYRSGGVIYAHPVELRQVFLNLIGNAVQAMPGGGTLRIRISEATDGLTGRRGIFLSVIDTGVGIDPENAEKLFQPFFSTKSTKGTGLGLWISKGIVQKYEGRIAFRSQYYKGRQATCFRVFLPAETTHSSAKSGGKPAADSVAVKVS